VLVGSSLKRTRPYWHCDTTGDSKRKVEHRTVAILSYTQEICTTRVLVPRVATQRVRNEGERSSEGRIERPYRQYNNKFWLDTRISRVLINRLIIQLEIVQNLFFFLNIYS
jgi:hypothetical protein